MKPPIPSGFCNSDLTHVSAPLIRALPTSLFAALAMCLAGPLAAAPAPVANVDMRPNAVAFRQMRYGLFVTQTFGVTSPPPGRKITTLDEFADAFDVQTFAGQMASMGVEYVYFTAWHKSIYFMGPSKALEKWLPGHTARRDVVGEIADALNKRNIKLVIYAHPNDGHDLTPEEQARVGFSDRAKDGNKKYNDFIQIRIRPCAESTRGPVDRPAQAN